MNITLRELQPYGSNSVELSANDFLDSDSEITIFIRLDNFDPGRHTINFFTMNEPFVKFIKQHRCWWKNNDQCEKNDNGIYHLQMWHNPTWEGLRCIRDFCNSDAGINLVIEELERCSILHEQLLLEYFDWCDQKLENVGHWGCDPKLAII